MKDSSEILCLISELSPHDSSNTVSFTFLVPAPSHPNITIPGHVIFKAKHC